jgi:hypothetical protein
VALDAWLKSEKPHGFFPQAFWPFGPSRNEGRKRLLKELLGTNALEIML